MSKLFSPGHHGPAASFGLLVLRLGTAGLMIFQHGWSKLTGFAEMKDTFPDPLGIGSTPALAATIATEVGCASLIALGLATRWAAVPFAFTMGVAAFVVHAADPFERKELALLYL